MNKSLLFKVSFVGLLYLLTIYHLSAQINWVKYQNNPVMQPDTSWNNYISMPTVIHDDGIFKMWHTAIEYTTNYLCISMQIGYAESTDGILWQSSPGPAIGVGTPGTWDHFKAGCSVIRMNDTLKMWYGGTPDTLYTGSIGYAWSVDSNIWNLRPTPVFETGQPGTWDQDGAFKPSVYYDGSTYHMWFIGPIGNYLNIGYATSPDGINWTKYPNNPVLSITPGSYYSQMLLMGNVVFVDNEFQVWFGGHDSTSFSPLKYVRIGFATSPDGINWTVQNNSQPVMGVGQAGDWDEYVNRYPCVLFHNGEYKMWFDGNGSSGISKIGYATSDQVGLHEDKSFTDFFNVYPNPAKDLISVEFNSVLSEVELEILNLTGQKVYHQTFQNKDKIELNLSTLPMGIYIMKLRNAESSGSCRIVRN